MSKATLTPDEYLATLKHPLKDAVIALRAIVRGADRRFDESIKWNSFNYSVGGADRVTFNVRGKDRVMVVFHVGAKKKSINLAASVSDPQGVLDWPSKDRAIASFESASEVKEHKSDITKLVRAWVGATEGL